MAALRVIDGLAIPAGARAMPVVLRNRYDAGLWRLAQPFLHALDHELSQLQVRETKLCAFGRSLAFDETEPFRVFRVMLLRRDQ